MHRLFIALRPPREIRAICLSSMAEGPAGWAWQDDEQLHITLRYIGEVNRTKAEEIAQSLESFHAPAPKVRIAGVGIFDHGARSALFARIVPKEPLDALHRKIDRRLVQLGLEPDRRPFLPHITLARRRRTAEDPAAWLERHAALASDPIPVSHLTLFESHIGQHGAVYEPILRVSLND